MKILVVCQHFYPENFRINDICFELSKKGHNVTVLTGLPNYPKGKVFKEYKYFKNRRQYINGVKIVRSSLVGRGTSTLMMGINYAWFAIFASLKALFMKKDFDIVYSYQLSPITMVWPAIVVKKMKKIPLVIHCLDQWPISVTTGPISKNSILYKFLFKLSVWTYDKGDKIILSSNSFKKYFKEELGISSSEKGLIFYPSYAESVYDNTKCIDNGVFDIIFAGNIGPAQDVETIVETANALKDRTDIFFHIVGDGLNYQNCIELKERYNLHNIKFYGYHNVEEMKEYYDLADCFMITMIDNVVVNNTLPAKLQSYMLAGKPIIGAINGEVKTVVDDSNCGLCTHSGNYEELANIILKIYNDKDSLMSYGRNAKSYYEKHFEKNHCINYLLQIFEDEILLKGRK